VGLLNPRKRKRKDTYPFAQGKRGVDKRNDYTAAGWNNEKEIKMV
jgi:hypothetical protein